MLAKKSVKEKYIFDLTFTDVHMGLQKVPKSDFKSHFSMSKIVNLYKKNFIEELLLKTLSINSILKIIYF